VTCNLGTIASGGSATVEIVVETLQDGVITNPAQVGSSTADPNPGNNSATAATTVLPAADLSIDLTDLPDPVNAGGLLTYTVTINNLGPDTAQAVSFTDPLPGGVTLISVDPSQGTCTPGAPVMCSLGSILAGDSAQITLVVQVNPSLLPGTLTNNVSVSSSTADPVSGNNNASETTTVTTQADLLMTKVDDPDPVVAGQDNLTYTLTIQNLGPSNALNLSVADTLPVGLTFISATPNTGTCSIAGRTVLCSMGTLPASASATVLIRTSVNSTAVGTLSNTATATTTTPDPDGGNNSDTELTTVNTLADVSLAMTDAPDPVVAGEPLTYTLTVLNSGPSQALGLTVVDTLPAGVDFVLSDPPCTVNGGQVTCSLGTLAVNDSVQVVLNVMVDPATTGALNNQAVISATTPDPDTGNNTRNAETTVTSEANLSLDIYDQPEALPPGDLLTYTLNITNLGPSDAQAVVVTNTLPGAVIFGSVTPSQGSCTGTAIIICNLGDLEAGAAAEVIIHVQVSPTAPQGTISNIGEVASPTFDPDPGNNLETEITFVSNEIVNLRLTLSDSPDPVMAGETLLYHLQVINLGPSNATGIVLTDTLPAAVTLIAAVPGQGSCNGAPPTVICELGSLAVNTTVDLDITVQVDPSASGPLSNSAVTSAIEPDPNTGNNSASVNTTVRAEADLAVGLSDAPDPVLPGATITYTLALTNHGPSDAQAVAVTATLPGGVAVISVTPGEPVCTASGETIACNLGILPAQEIAEITLLATVNLTIPGALNSSAIVTSETPDPDLDNNQAQETTTIPDTTPPTVAWVLPVGNQQRFDVTGEIVHLEVTASDNVGVARVRFFWFNPAPPPGVFVEIGSDDTSPYELDFDTGILNPAWNQIHAEAVDAAGNHSDWFNVDKSWIFLYQLGMKLFLPLVLR
jgi:uncharacterized repeat protein (TIGR01451 family)